MMEDIPRELLAQREHSYGWVPERGEYDELEAMRAKACDVAYRAEVEREKREEGCATWLLRIGAVGLLTTLATCRLGLIDGCRTAYNAITGNMPVLKAQLTDYLRKEIRKEMSPLEFNEREVESRLMKKLDYKGPMEGERIDPVYVNIEKLWDTVEENPSSPMDRWLWTSL